MMNNIFLWVSLLFIFSSLLFLKTKKNVAKQSKKLVPPGRPKLPLLGHLHLLGSLPHRSFSKLSKKYGPVMLLKLGSVPTVVVSSATAAREVLKVHDLASCSRPRFAAAEKFSYNYLDIALCPYGSYWREVRKICVLEIFSAKRVQSFQFIREEEINILLNSISQSSASAAQVDLSEKLYSLTANIITRIAFGKSFRGGQLDNENFQKVVRRAVAAFGGFSATDIFPRFGWIVDRLRSILFSVVKNRDVRGRMEKSFVELDAFFQHVVDDRSKLVGEICDHHDQENIVDVLLRMESDNYEIDAVQLTRDCIKALIMDIFLAGVETGASTVVWTMAELVKNPKVMKKLKDEIRSYIYEDDQVKESDLEKLQYLKMVVKEALRLHTPVPLLVPRETMSHFKLNGYDIDPKTQLHINVWAIGRDPELWTDPEEFLPERFIGSSIDYKGQSFELLPFGSGRRICPGMNMATVTVELALANLLLCFDWKLPKGMKEEDVDMEEDVGIAVAKKTPLRLVPDPYFNSN